MGLNDPAVTTETQEIDPRLDEPAESMIDTLMGYASIDPWKTDYQGARMAAKNAAQTGVMDQTAAAGNAFNMDMESAAQYLPEVSQIGGEDVYDTWAMAQSGVSPELQGFYDELFGANGLLAKYGLDGGSAGTTAEAATEGDGVYHPYQPDIYAANYNPNKDGSAYYSGGGDGGYGAQHGGGTGWGGLGDIAGQVGNAVSGAWGGAQDGWNS